MIIYSFRTTRSLILIVSLFLAFVCLLYYTVDRKTLKPSPVDGLSGSSIQGDQNSSPSPLLPAQPNLAVNDSSNCHHSPPHCIMEEKTCTDNESLPELIFVAGIEGSGHHIIKNLFDFPKTSPIRRPYIIENFVPNLHLMDPGWIESSKQMGFAIIHKNLFRQRLTPFLDKLNQAKKEGRRGLLVYVHSFPMGLGGILSTARPDLLVLKYFDCILYRLKVIVMKRHPLLAVISTLRRFGSRRYSVIDSSKFTLPLIKAIPPAYYPYIMQARIVEDQLIYLDQQIRRLGCSQVYILDFNSLFSQTARWRELKTLAMFIGLSYLETNVVIAANLTPPATKVSLPPTCVHCTYRVLYNFFEERKVMWPLLAV